MGVLSEFIQKTLSSSRVEAWPLLSGTDVNFPIMRTRQAQASIPESNPETVSTIETYWIIPHATAITKKLIVAELVKMSSPFMQPIRIYA
jgi:hypothetical protein